MLISVLFCYIYVVDFMVVLLLEVFQNEDQLSYVVLNWSSSWSCFVLMMHVDCCGRYKHEKDMDEWMEIFCTDEAAKLRKYGKAF